MTDLVKRLRDLAFMSGQRWDVVTVEQTAMREAADRIETLEAALAVFAYPEDADICDLRTQWKAANPDDYDELLVPAAWIRTARRALKAESK